MARNSRSEAIAKRKCRSIAGVQDSSHGGLGNDHPSGKPMSRRAFAYRHAAALNAEVVTAHLTGGEA